jgi:cystathionine beta-synthase
MSARLVAGLMFMYVWHRTGQASSRKAEYFRLVNAGDELVQIFDSISSVVGNTPLVRMSRIVPDLKHNLLAKCEFLNPGGSVKDRIAFRMVEAAEKDGRLKPGQSMVEGTGGNTGIGLALAAKLTGHKLTCVMTEKVNRDKQNLMRKLGAEVMVVPGGKSIDDPAHFINQARARATQTGAWFVDQFANQDNLTTHYETTGPEIWQQTGGNVDVLVAGVGTGGTLCGAGRFLKEQKPSIKLVLADPAGSTLLEVHKKIVGNPAPYIVEGIGGDFIPAIVDMDLIDHIIRIDDERSIAMTQQLLEKEAMFVGGSSGCIVAAALQYCRDANAAADGNRNAEVLNVVAILPSSGNLYLSTIFDNQWMQARYDSLGEVKK